MRRPSGLPRWTRHSKRASQGAPSTHRSGSGRSPALPGYFADRYDPDFKQQYLSMLERLLVEAATEAASRLEPARIGGCCRSSIRGR